MSSFKNDGLRNLVSSLLTKDPTRRLGFGGSEEVKQNEFFNDVKWENVDYGNNIAIEIERKIYDTSFAEDESKDGKRDKKGFENNLGDQSEAVNFENRIATYATSSNSQAEKAMERAMANVLENKSILFSVQHQAEKAMERAMANVLEKKDLSIERIQLSDLDIGSFDQLPILGQGSFGTVRLVQVQNRQLAMKMILKNRNDIDYTDILNEKDVMKTIGRDQYPFLVNFHSSFETPNYFCFLMDYAEKGSLREYTAILSEENAKLYSCEIFLAIEHLHSKKIMHGDIKVENVLVGSDGHLMLTDFGTATTDMAPGKKISIYQGTLSYMSPELVHGDAYGFEADWWAYGVLLHVLYTGRVLLTFISHPI